MVGVAIGITNGIGNLGGFFGPYVFGYVKTATNSFSSALFVGAAAFILAGVAAAPLRSGRATSTRLRPVSQAVAAGE